MITIKRILTLIGDLSFLVALGIMIFLSISISWEVFSRYVMGAPSTWVTEVSGYLVSGVLFMALGKVYREGGHVSMSLIVDKISPRNHKICVVLSDLLVMIFAIFLFWATFQMASMSFELNWKSSTILAVPLYLPQSLMPIGSFVFIIEIINKLLQDNFPTVNDKKTKLGMLL